jgi:uncharacterized membrane protein YtjA (UPF0391 family)
MLRWALIFFVVAIVAAFFGFGGIAAGAADISKFLFLGFVVLAAIASIAGLFTGRKTVNHLSEGRRGRRSSGRRRGLESAPAAAAASGSRSGRPE